MAVNNISRGLTLGAISTLLIACGGGDTPSPQTPSIPHTNQAPVVELGTEQISIREKEVETVSVKVTDTDSSSFSVSVSSTLLDVEYDEDSGDVLITAPVVNEDTQSSITVVATDSDNGETRKTISVTVINVPNAPPTISWSNHDEEPDFVVRERTELRLPFVATDVDSDDLTFDVDFSLVQGQGEGPEIQTIVDSEKGELVVLPQSLPSIFSIRYRGTLTVSDGENHASASFLIDIFPNSVGLNVTFDDILLFEGETKVVPIRIRANDIELFEFTDFYYENERDEVDDPLEFSVDKDERTITVTAKEGVSERTVNLRLAFSEGDYSSYTRPVNVTIRSDITECEQALKAKLDTYPAQLNMTNDYEYITRYALDILFGRGELSKEEYLTLIRENYAIRSVNVALAKLVGENIKHALLNTAKYSEPAECAQAFTELDSSLNNLRIFRGLNVPFTNEVLERIGYPLLTSEFSEEIAPGILSRFVGNPIYGSYVEDEWKFNDDYQYLSAPLGLLLNTQY